VYQVSSGLLTLVVSWCQSLEYRLNMHLYYEVPAAFQASTPLELSTMPNPCNLLLLVCLFFRKTR